MVPDEVRNLGRVLRVDSEVFHFFFRRREKAICSWEFCKGRNFLKNSLFLTSIEIRQRHDLINGVGGGGGKNILYFHCYCSYPYCL